MNFAYLRIIALLRYVLEKDLLKFQALYPPPSEQKPLGEIRGHKVYPRDTVHTLLGEKKWEKLARSIKASLYFNSKLCFRKERKPIKW